MTTTIDVTKVPWSIGEASIVAIEVDTVNFMTFIELGDKAITSAGRDTDNIEKYMLRERIMYQAVGVDGKGGKHTIDPASLLVLPACYVGELRAALTPDEPRTTMLNKGDGLSSPVHIKLGTPLILADESEVAELEILVPTYNELEDIIVGDTALHQTKMLIERGAKPVGTKTDFLTMPLTIMNQITVTDGAFIVAEVLPIFLE